MSMNREGRPTRPADAGEGAPPTWTGNRALMLEEPLIFEMDEADGCGVDFESPSPLQGRGPGRGGVPGDDAASSTAPLPTLSPEGERASRLAGLERLRPIGLPGL